MPPGSGVNETVQNPRDYSELAAIPEWRKRLSNFWVAPFELMGFHYQTVEHAFQAYKIRLADTETALQFTLESGSQLSRSDGEAARRARKLKLLTPEQLRGWEAMKDAVLLNALYAKFSQHSDLRRLLLATGNAELWHGAPRVAKARQWQLERIRDILRTQT